ncbi:hypothetical protein NDU88_006310 [Pleurodeles waltl]|uniref:Uncharacterized protein n=1 Tax=Pleurodeles waltl TaxID=8319 RepID=A0AAV7LRM9_PLEWA|nr:hypothetical protein NDU88_006310 [Pleurodeles waltl]
MRLFRSVRAQTRLETLRKNAREHWSARKSALWWTRQVSKYRSRSGWKKPTARVVAKQLAQYTRARDLTESYQEINTNSK